MKSLYLKAINSGRIWKITVANTALAGAAKRR